MRAVVQKVKNASVTIDDELYSSIAQGYLVLLGITSDDTDKDRDYIIDKLLHLRIFKDDEDKMNNDISSIDGELLIVSQFTLYGDARKGRRPSYIQAAKGDHAIEIYNDFINRLTEVYNKDKVKTGKFAAMMDVSLINDGPVTILLDSRKTF